jgi:hypothetical protein
MRDTERFASTQVSDGRYMDHYADCRPSSRQIARNSIATCRGPFYGFNLLASSSTLQDRENRAA